jgi:predicted kinase
MGASGTGESTLARELARLAGTVVISYDQCREELVGDPHEQTATAVAVELAHSRLQQMILDHDRAIQAPMLVA